MSQMGQGEGTLSAAAAMVADAKTDLDGLANTLRNQLQSLNTQWQGQGGAAFGRLALSWDERQRQINAALDGFEESLRMTERDNVSTDDDQAATMTNLEARLS